MTDRPRKRSRSAPAHTGPRLEGFAHLVTPQGPPASVEDHTGRLLAQVSGERQRLQELQGLVGPTEEIREQFQELRLVERELRGLS